jgi:hypothetical protein
MKTKDMKDMKMIKAAKAVLLLAAAFVLPVDAD